MRGLTLTQPWASLVALGAKRRETRGWRAAYRGPLAIHAAASFPAWARSLCHQEPFATALGSLAERDGALLPRQAIVAVVTLTDIVAADAVTDLDLSATERAFGDYGPGRFVWRLTDVAPIEPPISCSGARGLWEVGLDLRAALDAATGRLSGEER